MLKVHSYDEWSQLEEVVIGIADDANMPKRDYGMHLGIASGSNLSTISLPVVDKKIIEETKEDLDILSNELSKLNIRVRRPTPLGHYDISTPFWNTDQFSSYCPRDTLTILGDTILESPNSERSRYFETFSYRDLLLEYSKSGCKWIAAPKPRLRRQDYNKDIAMTITENDIIFDAANLLRAGKDIFYLVSMSGNISGYYWLLANFGHVYNIHKLENIYTGAHLDSTLAFLRPGLLLANPDRVNDKNLPEILKKWDVIYAPDMIESNSVASLSSKWLGMNLLMVNPELAIVDSLQISLIKLLEKQRIQVLPLRLRHGRVLGGGFHCVTLDVRRRGGQENYF